MRRHVRKCTIGHVRPAKIQISLRIRGLIRIFIGPFFHHENMPI